MITVTFDELRNNFDKYVDANMNGEKIVIAEDGKEFGMFEPSMYVLRDRFLEAVANGNYNADSQAKGFGVAQGTLQVPDDFDTWECDMKDFVGVL